MAVPHGITRRLWEGAGSAGDGVLYSLSFAPLNDVLTSKMRDRFGVDNVLDCTPQAHDGMRILSKVINKVGSNPEDIKNELYRTVYKSGISSSQIEFDENGDVRDSIYLVKQIQDGRAVEAEYYRTDQYGGEIIKN